MIQLDRLIRNIVLLIGVCLVIGGTATESLSAAAIVAGVFLSAAAVVGMWLTRRG